MSYNVGGVNTDQIVQDAVSVAQGGCNDIDNVLADIRTDNTLGNNNVTLDTDTKSPTYNTYIQESATGSTQQIAEANDMTTLASYGITLSTGGISINEAAGAMVVDDLMQKISTKVQVAAQLLSTSNNIEKTVSRIVSQG